MEYFCSPSIRRVLQRQEFIHEDQTQAILNAAQFPQRDLFVGGAAKLMSISARVAPRWMDKIAEKLMLKQQRSAIPERHPERNSLHQAGADMRVRGNHRGPVLESGLYTQAALHPKLTYAVVGAAAVDAVLLGRYRAGRSGRIQTLAAS